MLFGKRPFGEGKSQERVLSEGIMLHATQVNNSNNYNNYHNLINYYFIILLG